MYIYIYTYIMCYYIMVYIIVYGILAVKMSTMQMGCYQWSLTSITRLITHCNVP